MLGFITEPIKSCAGGDPPTGRKSNPKTYLVLLLLAIGVIFAGREIIAGDENNSSPTALPAMLTTANI